MTLILEDAPDTVRKSRHPISLQKYEDVYRFRRGRALVKIAHSFAGTSVRTQPVPSRHSGMLKSPVFSASIAVQVRLIRACLPEWIRPLVMGGSYEWSAGGPEFPGAASNLYHHRFLENGYQNCFQ